MKKILSFSQTQKLIFVSFLLAFSAFNSFGQKLTPKERLALIMANPEYANELPDIAKMRSEGKTDDQVYNWLEEKGQQSRKKAMRYRDIVLGQNNKGQIVNISNCVGDSIGVDGGVFGLWKGDTMCWSSVASNCTPNSFTPTALPNVGRIQIVNSGSDPCADVKPIPLPSPYGGPFSIKLGNNNIQAKSERITYKFIVKAGDANFVYQYAAVLENPAAHTNAEQPFFDFVILDQNGDTIPCSFQHYVAGPGIPGFLTSNLSNVNCNTYSNSLPSPVYYSQWTMVGVHLSSYINQQVTVVCTTADCSRCGHFGYTYLDFSCGAVSTAQFCVGNDSIMLAAPYDPAFTYSWSPSGETTSSIVAHPSQWLSDTVHITQAISLCGFDLIFNLSPTVMHPAFTYSVDCATGSAIVKDSSWVTGGSIVAWNWQFPGGTPSSYNGQNPPPITYPPGAHTITLTVTSQAGCTKDTVQTITVGHVPVSDFTYTPRYSCDGTTVDFSETSQFASAYHWIFLDNGDTSNLTNPSHLYINHGTYSVTLISISTPCADTITKAVVLVAGTNTLKTPNVFTPNNDTHNDCFKPFFVDVNGQIVIGNVMDSCFSLEVYDRWGIQMYKSNGGGACWDGKTKGGSEAKDGTYYYIISFAGSKYKGFLELLRNAKK